MLLLVLFTDAWCYLAVQTCVLVSSLAWLAFVTFDQCVVVLIVHFNFIYIKCNDYEMTKLFILLMLLLDEPIAFVSRADGNAK